MSDEHPQDRRIALACSKVLKGEPIVEVHAHELTGNSVMVLGPRLCVQFLCEHDHHNDSIVTSDDHPQLMCWFCFLKEFGKDLPDFIQQISSPCVYVLAGGQWVEIPEEMDVN